MASRNKPQVNGYKWWQKPPLVIAAGVALMAWPFVLPDSAFRSLARSMPVGANMMLWGITTFSGVMVLIGALMRHLRGQGRIWMPGQPDAGLAGKTTGLLTPGAWVGPAVAFGIVIGVTGWATGVTSAVLSVPVILMCSYLGVVYGRTLRTKRQQRRAMLSRNDAPSESVADPDVSNALAVIAAVVRVPPRKLRTSDKFGADIGTFSDLDETLDHLGGKLLMQQQNARRPLRLEHIRTVGEYVAEWRECSG